jgi:hypothetical protein
MKPSPPIFLVPAEWGVINCDSHTPVERNGYADTGVRAAIVPSAGADDGRCHFREGAYR